MKPSKIIMSLIFFGLSFVLSACNTSATEMQFSFNTSAAADSKDSKAIYINNDMDKLELDAILKIGSGKVTIQVIDTLTNEVIWIKYADKDSAFKIELLELKADREYLLVIEAFQSKEVKCTITTDVKLIKDKEKPDRYKIE